jgi:tetratricopeptide (TPR) repeat protein
MTAESLDTYLKDPLYQSSIKHLQLGEWEPGLNELDQLVTKYPLNHQLRSLRQDMKVRARVDEDEQQDHVEALRKSRKKWAIRLFITAIAAGLLIWGVRSYSTWIGQQMLFARQQVEDQVQRMELAVKFRNGQDLLLAGRLTEAKTSFEEVLSVDPTYTGLGDALRQTEKMITLESQYEEALRKINLGEMTSAVEILENIESQEPFYKDVSMRIAEIKSQFFLGDILAQAEKAYQENDWINAASGYETLRALNPQYQTETVEEHLFNSYMNAAVGTLSEDTESLEALDEAETYFRKALTLRPQDPVIKLEREQARQSFKDRLFRSYVDAAQTAINSKPDSLEALSTADSYFFRALELLPNDSQVTLHRRIAHLFIQAQQDFEKNRWAEVIQGLEEVILEDPTYAAGTARQTLYEAYIARGDAELLSGNYEEALTDFQRSAVLAEQGENTKLRLFQAQIRIAEALGTLLQYEDADLLYRSAIDSAELREEDLKERPDLVNKLRQADGYLQSRNYRAAYRLYRVQARKILIIFPTVTYEVQNGDYITSVARQYNTTVEAIRQANNLASGQKLELGQELVIPVQP